MAVQEAEEDEDVAEESADNENAVKNVYCIRSGSSCLSRQNGHFFPNIARFRTQDLEHKI